MTRTLMLLLAALAALAVATSALGSATSTASLNVRPGTVKPAGAVHIWGNAGSCAAGRKLVALSAAFPEYSFGVGGVTGPVRADHTFSFWRHLRGNVPPGGYSVSARCGGGNLGVTAHVQVS